MDVPKDTERAEYVIDWVRDDPGDPEYYMLIQVTTPDNRKLVYHVAKKPIVP